MSALWTVTDLVAAAGGTANGNWRAQKVEIDSRKVRSGDLFVAIKGERFDGHDYVEDAFLHGAVAAVVSRKSEVAGNKLLVTDTLKALEDLGKYNRSRSTAKIIGITGSVGKTSTKEMLRLALSAHGQAYATSGNYNNHIGTPLNLANLPPDADFAVFEMGMNHKGEISHLTRMVRPHVALVTGVEAVHLEFFSSVNEIAEAKAEIFEGVTGQGENSGVAIINSDQPYFADIPIPRITFGTNKKADCRLLSYKPTISGCEVSANIMGETVNYTMAATGRHWSVISLSVLAVCGALGLDIRKTAVALSGFSEVDGRGRVVKINVNGGQVLLVNDSYNASPASMVAAFEKTSEVWQSYGKKGRKIALLGDMLELGKTAAALHAGLAESLMEQGFDKVYTAGNLMRHLYDALPSGLQGGHAQDAASLLPMVGGVFKSGDVVLVKGSHGSKMYELADALLAEKEKIKNAV